MNAIWKLTAALGVAGVIALSMSTAEARVVHHKAAVHGAVHAHHSSHRGSYNYYAVPGTGGFHGEPNGPDNYNPNES